MVSLTDIKIIIIYIIIHIPYVPYTIMGNSIYSGVLARILKQRKLRYIHCSQGRDIKSQEIVHEGESIPINIINPTRAQFTSIQTPFIPHNDKELSLLSAHCQIPLPVLQHSQKQVLKNFGNTINLHDLTEDPTYHMSIKVRTISSSMYRFTTPSSSWCSRSIFTDDVGPLPPDAIVIGRHFTMVESVYDLSPIIYHATSDKCVITYSKGQYTMKMLPSYIVNHDLAYKIIQEPEENISPLYTLKHPYAFNKILWHPFCLPSVYDTILAIMVIFSVLL